MTLLTLYRVRKDYHNEQYFYSRDLAEDFAKEMNADVDILYFYNEEQRVKKYNSMKEW